MTVPTPDPRPKIEHFPMLGLFGVIHIWGVFTDLQTILSPQSFAAIAVTVIMSLPIFLFEVITIGISVGLLGGFSGRMPQMFDPSYASKHIPIISSVAEHQMSGWSNPFIDCGFFLLVFPLGCYLLLRNQPTVSNETQYLLLIYGLSTMYFASIMVRLVLCFTPPVAVLGGLAIRRIAVGAMRSRTALGSVLQWAILFLCICSCAHGA
jgi:dolichyl-diphosphooligosaccharide--protein glycosyltransferase